MSMQGFYTVMTSVGARMGTAVIAGHAIARQCSSLEALVVDGLAVAGLHLPSPPPFPPPPLPPPPSPLPPPDFSPPSFSRSRAVCFPPTSLEEEDTCMSYAWEEEDTCSVICVGTCFLRPVFLSPPCAAYCCVCVSVCGCEGGGGQGVASLLLI